MRIAVFGTGHVGAVLCGCLSQLGHHIVAVDRNQATIENIGRGRSPVAESGLDDLISAAVQAGSLRATGSAAEAIRETELAFVCVDTPNAPDGALSLVNIEDVLGTIGDALRGVSHDYTVVLRSTVPPGAGEGLCIPLLEMRSGRRHGHGLTYLANPEFFRQGSAVRDFLEPSVIYVGAAAGTDIGPLREVYRRIGAPVQVGTLRSVESVKLVSNVFHGLKVAFANEIGAVLAAHGVDARETLRLFCADTSLNISSSYLRPGFAFGGPCLNKDLQGLLMLAKAAGLSTPLLGQLAPSNELVIERAVGIILAGGWRKVAMVGLAFKPGTAEIRNSPYVALALRLLAEGLELRIFDAALAECPPEASQRLRNISANLADRLVRTPEQALDDSDLIIVCHPWALLRDQLRPGQALIDLETIAGAEADTYRLSGAGRKRTEIC